MKLGLVLLGITLFSCGGGGSSLPDAVSLPDSPSPDADIEPEVNQFELDFLDNEFGGNVWLRDLSNDQIVLNIAKARQFGFQDPAVNVEHRYDLKPWGFDLIIDCTNTALVDKPLPTFIFENFNLGQHIRYRDFRTNAVLKSADWATHIGIGHNYPDSLYSPVWVLENDEYTIGLSLQYPMLEYKHDVQINMGSPSTDENDLYRGWLVEFRAYNPPGESSVTHPAVLTPGETKHYVVSLRITRHSSRWMKTLVPYRDYFRQMVGGVRYARNPRPVWPISISSTGTEGPGNLMGFNWSGSRRPDVYGWVPWTQAILARASEFSRVMLWGPSGLYDGSSANWNYPYQFATNWLTNSQMATATHPTLGLRPVSDHGIDLGLWWGRSVQIARQWNPTEMENFNPHDSENVIRALQELDLAVAAGATRIGLDTFAHSYCPGWDLVYWLDFMKARHPGVEFITEAMCFDMLHARAPTFMAGWPASIATTEQRYPVNTPHYMADFLLPGHEIWLAYSYNAHRLVGVTPTQEMMCADQVYIASLGYVPVILEEFFVPQPGVVAAETWRSSVPVDLR